MRVIAARLVANAAVIVGLDVWIDFDDWFQDFRCRVRVVAARLVTNATIFLGLARSFIGFVALPFFVTNDWHRLEYSRK